MRTRWWKQSRSKFVAVALLVTPVLVLLSLPPSNPPSASLTAVFPLVAPRQLAHELADFSAHARHNDDFGEWTIEEESGNYSAWRYSVQYLCGARCSGRAVVLAMDEHGGVATHAAPRKHHVRAMHRECRRLAFLPWPELCDEWETRSEVVSDGSQGARLHETTHASCALAGITRGGAATCAGTLLRRRAKLIERLRDHLLHTA